MTKTIGKLMVFGGNGQGGSSPILIGGVSSSISLNIESFQKLP